jgi:hypothetical protein
LKHWRQRIKRTFTLLHRDEPIQQLELEIPEGQDVECLLDHLKLHFNKWGMGAEQKEARLKVRVTGCRR